MLWGGVWGDIDMVVASEKERKNYKKERLGFLKAGLLALADAHLEAAKAGPSEAEKRK